MLFRRQFFRVCVAALALAPILPAPSGAQAAGPGNTPLANSAVDWWLPRHEAKVQEVAAARGRVKLVFIGDSITHDYELTSTAPQYDFLAVWKRYYGDREAINLGFSGDNTANVLWRLENGEFDGIAPRVAVILIGTNNTAQGQTVQQTTDGIEAIVATVRGKSPRTRILLLGLLPSAMSAQKTAADRSVNLYLAGRYQGDAMVTYLDVSRVFMANGAINTALYMDPRNNPPGPAVHPDAFAQARMAAAIEPTLARLLGDRPKPPQD